MQPNAAPSLDASARLVEAARYALLRRLAFAMRHQMVVHLQPIGMITEVLERRLRQRSPDLAQVHESMARINGFSRSAVQACLDVVTWLAPDAEARVPLDAAVQECVALLRSNFSFRGFALRDTCGAQPALVVRGALRNVLPACLLALADASQSPADVAIRAEVTPVQAVLELQVTASEGAAGFADDTPYRLLRWDEVEAMGRADGIAVSHGDNGQGAWARLVIAVAA